MASEEVDDADGRFNYKDNAWAVGGQVGEFDGTSHSTSTSGAQVVFGPFFGTHDPECPCFPKRVNLFRPLQANL